ncbi:MAG: DUF2887 domain-containing protein [Okeania sp. SIO2G4]|nr:DUF2887 domain-containing protein [Okeania sp. SIO4D6]NEP38700.1 DUF2887 domain-containing protein [Okeania sp. SIO2H7]NEP75786.1 DUF2887 domain-containing protein [Okeania sp. SIO2G5]NEP96961.1 DUF2887 domain-containing protein [Okeania sp. SIO2F5]NEQ94603.1 DUF2887 domain-containing protein [Okeania sp. SIO2G4]
MKTDSIFYQIFLNFPRIFFELINQPNTNTQTYEFTSREVKQLSFRLDGLFLPTDNNPNKPFYRKMISKASPFKEMKKIIQFSISYLRLKSEVLITDN